MAALVITILLNTKSDFYFQFTNYGYEFHQYEFIFYVDDIFLVLNSNCSIRTDFTYYSGVSIVSL